MAERSELLNVGTLEQIGFLTQRERFEGIKTMKIGSLAGQQLNNQSYGL